MTSVDERLEALETRIAFQDRTIDDLNDVVSELRLEMDQLSKQVKQLTEQAKASFINKDGENKPPHY